MLFLPLVLLTFANQLLAATTPSPLFSAFQETNYAEIQKEIFKIIQQLPQSECTNQFLSLSFGFQNGENWALRMLDASAKPQSGILHGNIMHVGNYDECLAIDENNSKGRIQGKYCTAMFQPHPKYGQDVEELLENLINDYKRSDDEKDITEKARLSYGFCLPKTCTAKILQNITDILEDSLESTLHFEFLDDYCDDTDGKKFSGSAIFGIVVFSIFAVILICGTLYDVLVYSKLSEDQRQPNLLIAFSMYTNAQKIFATTTAKGNLKCLNGLRVISMMWILLAHGFQSIFFVPHVNAQRILEWKDDTINAIVIGSSMSVDTFFVISGLLVVFLFMKSQAKGITFNLPMFYIHRLLRLTPSLAMVVLFTTTLNNYIGSGPFWPVVDELYQKPCAKNWWVTLIYLQNYINPNEQCVGQAWYLAVDTQMYFLSPLILFPLLRWPKQTIAGIVLFVVLNCSYVFEITWKKQLGTTFLDQGKDQYNYLYSPTHVRGTAYLLGMICGYFIYKTKTDKPIKLTRKQVVGLWIFSLGVMLAIVFGHSPLVQGPEYMVLESSFFNSLTRVGWSIALSIIIVLCVNDYGGPINSFLSNDIFTVLIRLNYSVYLVHLTVLVWVVAQGRTPTYFSNLLGFHSFWGDYFFTLGLALLWTLAFECPIITIEKLLFGKKSNVKQNKNVEGSVAVDINGTSNLNGIDPKILNNN